MKISSQFTSKSNALRSAFLVTAAISVIAGGWLFATRPTHAYTADAFVMRVKTDNGGTSGANQFTIPAQSQGGVALNYNVDCNDDGVIDIANATAATTCTYPIAGTYTIAITGAFPRITFNNGGDRLKLLEIRQWGTGVWRSFEQAFAGTANMQLTATDAPNLSQVTSLRQMFRSATAFTGNASMASWNTSNVTDFWYLFDAAVNFNAPIGSWDTAKATHMVGVFSGAAAFNQPLDNWNTTNVTNFQAMFSGATTFNQNLNSWNTSKNTNTAYMFNGARDFNGQISNWDMSKVTTVFQMFQNTTAFNQPIGSWNTSSVQDMASMFQNARGFNQPINTWNVANVTGMNSMFANAILFNQDLNSWNTGKVVGMGSTFQGAAAFNGNITSWNTANVTNITSTFLNAVSFNQPIGGWDTGKVTNLSNTFSGATAFNQPLNNWNVANVTSLNWTFNNAKAFNQDLNSWSTSKVTTLANTFAGTTVFNGEIGAWDTSKVTDMVGTFNAALAFNRPIDTWNVSAVTAMNNTFASTKAFTQSLNSWDTANVINMAGMFHQASGFNGAIANWNTEKVTSMNLMFRGAILFNQPIGGWNTSKVTSMASMLEGTRQFNQPLGAWDTSSVTTLGAILYGASKFNQPVGTWNVQNVTDMSNTFLSTAMSVANYDSTLQGWLAGGVKNNVPLRATARYCAAESARATLIATYGWVISDTGKGCPAPSVTISAPTKLKNSPITDTTITVTESYADLTINAANVIIGAGTTVTRSGYACTQVDTKTVTCSLSINSNGTLAITATNSGGGAVTRSETGYIVDTVKPTLSASIDTTTGINTPRLTFTVTDNVAVARTEVLYYANNGGPGIPATMTTINPATSPVNLVLDPDEAVHHIIVRSYDTAGNMTERDLLFPPIVTFNAPTQVSNWDINNATVTITAPSGNPIDNITITNGGTDATLQSCVGAGNDTTSPYNQPVTCQIRNVKKTGTVTVRARDAGNAATGQNSQSFTIDTVAPTIHVSSPTKRSNQDITDITVTVTDDIAVNADALWTYLFDETGDLQILDVNCTQVYTSEVSCQVSLTGTNGTTAIEFGALDVAGNYGYTFEYDYEIDRTPPVVSTIGMLDDSDSGIKGDNRTNAKAPVFVIPCAERNSSIEIYLNSESFTEIPCGDQEAIETILREFEDGTYTVSYVAIDELGNRSEMSEDYAFTVDTVIPGATIELAAGQDATITGGEARFTIKFSKPVQAPITDFVQVAGLEGATTEAEIDSIEEISPTEFRVKVKNIAEGETVRLLLLAGITDLSGNAMDEEGLALIGEEQTITHLIPEIIAPEPGTSLVPGVPNTGLLSIKQGLLWAVLLVGLGSLVAYLIVGYRRNRA